MHSCPRRSATASLSLWCQPERLTPQRWLLPPPVPLWLKPLLVSRHKCCFPNPRHYVNGHPTGALQGGKPVNLFEATKANPKDGTGGVRRLAPKGVGEWDRYWTEEEWRTHHAALHAREGRSRALLWDNQTATFVERGPEYVNWIP